MRSSVTATWAADGESVTSTGFSGLPEGAGLDGPGWGERGCGGGGGAAAAAAADGAAPSSTGRTCTRPAD